MLTLQSRLHILNFLYRERNKTRNRYVHCEWSRLRLVCYCFVSLLPFPSHVRSLCFWTFFAQNFSEYFVEFFSVFVFEKTFKMIVNASNDLTWLVTRNSSSFLMKRRGVNHHFSRDPLNPKGLYKPRFQGTVQKRALSVVENPSGKGVVLKYKSKHQQNKPAKSVTSVQLSRGSRRAFKAIKNVTNKQNYRKDLKNVSFFTISMYFWAIFDISKCSKSSKILSLFFFLF